MYAPKKVETGRRKFLAGASALGTAGLLGLYPRSAAAEPPPETTRIRLAHSPYICLAPQYLAEDFLRFEGFTECEYLPLGSREVLNRLADGRADITMSPAPELVFHLDAGQPIVLLAGVHGGCFELFGNDRVRAIRDLRGKTAAIHYVGGADHVLLSSMVAYVGINPLREVNWMTGRDVRNAMDLFADGRADAFIGFAQEPAELRAKKVGRVIVNTAQDKPWSQYFCCMVAANRDFAQRNPIACKRALRAILKAADICAAEPERAARFLAEKLYEPRYAIGLEVMKGSQYTRWRDANPEDTIRFHALRLHEVGMIKSTPEKIIAQGTDWRYLNELKKELKA
jgi:NitT/TauT family transport system substrate-binding protein